MKRQHISTATTNPSKLPTMASCQRWPWISFTGVKGMSKRSDTCFPRRLSALDWSPADRRTPTASRMTIRLRKNDTMNRESNPSTKAIEADNETTSAEWLEGIPPVFQSMMNAISFAWSFRRFNTVKSAFITCARKMLNVPERKIGFENSDTKLCDCISTFKVCEKRQCLSSPKIMKFLRWPRLL